MRSNMTKAECILWERVRRKQITDLQFYGQEPLGNYIVYCRSGQLVIEVYGPQHQRPEDKEYDKKRDAYLNGLDLTVLRFTNQNIIDNTNTGRARNRINNEFSFL